MVLSLLTRKSSLIASKIPHTGTHFRYISSTTSKLSEALQESYRDESFLTIDEEVLEANERCEGIAAIKQTSSLGDGWGVMASKPFAGGELILSSTAIATITKDAHSLQKDWDKHVLIDLPARFINHSCNANVGLQDNDKGAYDFIALREIPEGAELFWDYETTEYDITGFDMCMCGEKRCRGSIGGFHKHGEQIKHHYGKYHAAYLKDA